MQRAAQGERGVSDEVLVVLSGEIVPLRSFDLPEPVEEPVHQVVVAF